VSMFCRWACSHFTVSWGCYPRR